jgi:SAM-dependent methyltransferase
LSIDLCVGDQSWDFSHIDIKAPLHNIPLDDSFADVIICIEVLEHIPNPHEAVQELARLLKPGGSIYLSVPFSAREHQVPYDYFRYTSFGLEYLFKEAGLNVEYIKPVRGDMYRLFCVLGEQGAHLKNSNPLKIPIILLKIYLSFFLEILEKFEHDRHGTGAWLSKANKP